MDAATLYDQVSSRYTATAHSVPSSQHASTVAAAFGYSPEDLSSISSDSNLGLSCGNPLALARLKEGETVVDLGCGAGFDVLLAARRVGEEGQVVGIDMNEAMLAKARANAAKAHTTNVNFVQAKISQVRLPDEVAHVVLSNCVINLVPQEEKHVVFREMYRLLKPGGRVAVTDILTRKPLPDGLKRNVALYVGCIAGASSKEEYEQWLKEAGFDDVLVVDAGSDLNVYTRPGADEGSCCGPETGDKSARMVSCCANETKKDGGVAEDMRRDLSDLDLNEWAGSFKIWAVKKKYVPNSTDFR